MKYDTKLQRKEVYEAIIKDLKSCKSIYSICWTIAGIFNTDNLNPAVHIMENHLPELIKQKPRKVNFRTYDGHDWWWDSYNLKRRIKALEDAIKLCEQ